MSNAPNNRPEEGKRIVEINLDDIPKVLRLNAYRKSPHISQPEKIKLFHTLFDDLYAYCEGLEGEFLLSSNRDYATYYQMMFEFARPKMQEMYDEHGPDLERMIMHISKEMIDDKRKFLPFFLLQMFMLEKGVVRNTPLTQRLLAAKSTEDVDFADVHDNLRRDAQNLLFLSSNYYCTFITPHPDNVLIGTGIVGQKKFIGTRRKWETKKMITRAVPGYFESLKLQEQLDAHIDQVLTPNKEDKGMGALFYYLIELQPTDMPEIMLFMGNFVTFDIPECEDPLRKYLVTINRTKRQHEMDFFKSLLAATHLACYRGMMDILTATPYLYLWRRLLDENKEMRKNVASRPLSVEGKFFRELFDENDLASILRSEEEGTQNGEIKVEKYILPRNFDTFGDADLENKRAEVNARITDIMNDRIKVIDKAKEIDRLNNYVLELSRCIAGRASSVFEGRFLKPKDIRTLEEERIKAAHLEKRIELDTTLVGLELHDRKQPGHIDCSLILMTGYPAGSLISVSRKMPGDKEYTFIYENIRLPADGMISVPQETLQQNGKIVYRVTFIAPEGREFEINTTTKTVTLETNYLHKPYEPLMPVSRAPEPTEEEKERASLEATLALLSTYRDAYRARGVYADGVVTLRLDESHILSPSKILPKHRQWCVDDDRAITPEIENGRDLILSLAEEIRVRVRQENEEKEEKNKETQSLSTALMVLSDHQEFYEQEGEYAEGIVTICLEDEHIQSVLQILGEEGVEVRPHHRSWTITDKGLISGVLETEAQDMMIALAEKIRARVKQEQIEEEDRKKSAFIAAIDAEFQNLGFTVGDALDTGDLRGVLEAKITSFRTKNIDATASWDKEIARLAAQCREKGYVFYRAQCKNGFPESITLGKKGGWLGILELQPVLNFKLKNAPQEHERIFRQRLENVMMTFAYDAMKNGNHSLEALVQETRAKEDLAQLKKHYKRELKNKKAKILVQDTSGQFKIIRNISKANLETELASAQETYGEGNVVLLLREATYRFQGESGGIRFDVGKILATYSDFQDPEIGHERKKILRERIVRTLWRKHLIGATKRGEFIPGSGVDQVLTEVRDIFQAKRGLLTEKDIDDEFLNAFIEKLKTGDNPVPVSYVDHRVAYCRPEDVSSFIAD